MKKIPILAFCHIHKAGGMTLRYILRRNFGIHHIDLEPRRIPHSRRWHNDYNIHPRDLYIDLKIHPWARSLNGHFLRPLEEINVGRRELIWYTFLRDPVKRYVSHYLWSAKIPNGTFVDFEEWLEKSNIENLQTRWLVGDHGIEAAKDLLASNFRFVGIVEFFDESLLLFRHLMGLNGFDVAYGKPKNTAKEREDKERIQEVWNQADRFRDRVLENNKQDIELYEYAKTKLWPAQVAKYGAEKLKRDRDSCFQTNRDYVFSNWKLYLGMAYRNIIYKPIVNWDTKRIVRCNETNMSEMTP